MAIGCISIYTPEQLIELYNHLNVAFFLETIYQQWDVVVVFGLDGFCLFKVRVPEFDMVYTVHFPQLPQFSGERFPVQFLGHTLKSAEKASPKFNESITLLI
jgi:hypothetical protein